MPSRVNCVIIMLLETLFMIKHYVNLKLFFIQMTLHIMM